MDHEATGIGDLAENARLDVPLLRHGEEPGELLRGDDCHHPLLALRHENLFGRESGVAQQNLLKLDEHAAIAIGCELRSPARNAGGAEVLNSLDELALEQLEAALDQHLFRERVANLHRWALGRPALAEGV